jgi:predicted Rossmann-fold nucleotide-binding protein
VLLDTQNFWAGLLQQIDRAVREGFDDAEALDYFRVTGDPAAALDLCEASVRR